MRELDADPKVRVWDVATGRQIATANVGPAADFGTAFSPDGKRIAMGGTDRSVKLYNALGGNEIMANGVRHEP